MKEIRMNLSTLLTDAGSAMPFKYRGRDSVITGITDDTRNVSEGNIFVCVRGGRFDGHDAAAEMISKGAAAVVCDHDLGLKDRQILVSDTRLFYGHLIAAWFSHPEKKLILCGVTGTNGKTTMTTMIHHILTHAGAKAGLIGTTGALIGKTPIERDESTPTTPKVAELYEMFARMVEEGCRYCVMEVSSFALEQNRIGPAVFTAGVFTNLTQDHLDYHGTMENYYKAKKMLFTDHCRLALINTDDRWGKKLYSEISCQKFSYGFDSSCSVYADFIRYANSTTHFCFMIPGKQFKFSIRMMGKYNVSNAVAAIAVCSKLNVPMEKITSALAEFAGVRGRCEIIPTHTDFLIVCDYAHSPDALENMLPSIKESTEGRLICLFGCGGDRDNTKRPLMAKAAAKFADYLIITSDNPRNEDPDAIIDEIISGIEPGCPIPYDRITDRKEAIFHAVRIAQKGDVIVLAGKGHEDYQVLAGGVHIHFDEREIAAQALEALKVRNVDMGTDLCSGMSIDEICAATGGKRVNISTALRMINAGSISSDTRTIGKGCLFIAFKGTRTDGHDYVKEALEKGAIAAITDHPVKDYPCIVVDDTYRAIMQIASHYRSKFTPKLVGVTGSCGKTTTKEMISLTLSSAYETLKTEGNLNNEIGMPFTLLRLRPEHKAAVIEMGMSHFGEIDRLSRTCRPSVCVITNIGWSHAENLGSQEGILKAKLEILGGAAENAPLITNGDDPFLAPLRDTITDRKVILCGVENRSCDYLADEIEADAEHTAFSVIKNGEKIARVMLNCAGRHHIIDALLAFAAAEAAGCKDTKKIAEQLSLFHLDGLRQHVEYRKGQTLVIDCYNAAPASMKAAIDVLSEIKPGPGGKRVAVLGDMLELGTLSAQLHGEVGAYAAEKKIDLVIGYGQYAQFIVKKASEMGVLCCAATEQSEVVNFMNFKLSENDVVLFKASRSMHMEKIIESYYGN